MKHLLITLIVVMAIHIDAIKAQVFDITIGHDDTSHYAIDMLLDNNESSYLLLQQSEFEVGVVGIPIGGALTWRSKIIKIDSTGSVQWAKPYETSIWQNNINLESFGRKPAINLVQNAFAIDTLTLPYVIHIGGEICTPATTASYVNRFGIITINSETGDALANALVDSFSVCPFDYEDLSFAVADHVFSVVYDAYNKQQHFIMSKNSQVIYHLIKDAPVRSTYYYTQHSNYHFTQVTNIGNQTYIYTLDTLANILQTRSIPDIANGYTPLMKMLSDGSYLHREYYFFDFANKYSVLKMYSAANDLLWSKTYTDELIVDIEVTAQNEYLLLGQVGVQGQSNHAKVTKIDDAGNTIAFREYDNLQPVKIKKVNEAAFMILGEIGGYTIDTSVSIKTRVIKDLFTNLMTAVKEKEDIPNVSIYPNPVADVLHIELSATAETDFSYSISNVLGQTVQVGKLTNRHLDIPLGTLPQGSYIFTLYKGQQRGSWRFVKR